MTMINKKMNYAFSKSTFSDGPKQGWLPLLVLNKSIWIHNWFNCCTMMDIVIMTLYRVSASYWINRCLSRAITRAKSGTTPIPIDPRPKNCSAGSPETALSCSDPATANPTLSPSHSGQYTTHTTQSSFRAVSEQFQSSFRAVLEQF